MIKNAMERCMGTNLVPNIAVLSSKLPCTSRKVEYILLRYFHTPMYGYFKFASKSLGESDSFSQIHRPYSWNVQEIRRSGL